MPFYSMTTSLNPSPPRTRMGSALTAQKLGATATATATTVRFSNSNSTATSHHHHSSHAEQQTNSSGGPPPPPQQQQPAGGSSNSNQGKIVNIKYVLKNLILVIILKTRVGHCVLFRSARSVLFHSLKWTFHSFVFFSWVFGDLWDPKEQKRTQRTQRSFAKNVKERENV